MAVGVPKTVPLDAPNDSPLGRAGLTLNDNAAAPEVWPPKLCMVVPFTNDRLVAGYCRVMAGATTAMVTVAESFAPPAVDTVMV